MSEAFIERAYQKVLVTNEAPELIKVAASSEEFTLLNFLSDVPFLKNDTFKAFLKGFIPSQLKI